MDEGDWPAKNQITDWLLVNPTAPVEGGAAPVEGGAAFYRCHPSASYHHVISIMRLVYIASKRRQSDLRPKIDITLVSEYEVNHHPISPSLEVLSRCLVIRETASWCSFVLFPKNAFPISFRYEVVNGNVSFHNRFPSQIKSDLIRIVTNHVMRPTVHVFAWISE